MEKYLIKVTETSNGTNNFLPINTKCIGYYGIKDGFMTLIWTDADDSYWTSKGYYISYQKKSTRGLSINMLINYGFDTETQALNCLKDSYNGSRYSSNSYWSISYGIVKFEFEESNYDTISN